MSASNGTEIIKLGMKGRKTFQLEDGEPFTVDIVEVNTQWVEIDRKYRDAEGKIPPEQISSLNYACWDFVKGLCGDPKIPMALALEFMKHVTEEADRLQDFFVPKLVKREPSSQESSTTMRFST